MRLQGGIRNLKGEIPFIFISCLKQFSRHMDRGDLFHSQSQFIQLYKVMTGR